MQYHRFAVFPILLAGLIQPQLKQQLYVLPPHDVSNLQQTFLPLLRRAGLPVDFCVRLPKVFHVLIILLSAFFPTRPSFYFALPIMYIFLLKKF
jgi:hypothetical protein